MDKQHPSPLGWLLAPTSNAPRISEKEGVALELLRDGTERFGLQLVREADGQLRAGTVYVVLSRLEEKGFVVSRQDEVEPWAGGPRRRLYRITPDGKSVVDGYSALARSLRAIASEVG